MSTRQLASPKQRRGEITTDADIERVFSHIHKAKPEPANIDTNRWEVKPFKSIIRGDKHNSALPHDTEAEIKNGRQYADWLNISYNTFLTLVYEDFPRGSPTSAKTLADKTVEDYQKTLCHQYLQKHYENPITGDWGSGKPVDSMGQYLYMKFGQRDPALFTLEQFRQAKADPSFFKATGKIKPEKLSHIKCIMKFAALQIKDSPLNEARFQFVDGDEWYAGGLKNIGGKLDDFLQEDELKRYVQGINEIDTLVMHRLGLEGFGRFSSQLLMGVKLPDGYTCQALWDLNTLSMMEPKVEGSKTGGKVKRRFTPETMAFFKRYVTDFNIKGAWFNRYPSEEHNYQSYSVSIKLAGLRAGLWRWKLSKNGQDLAEGQKATPDGRVYKLKPFNNTKKGTVEYRKDWITEGKMTTTHTVMKHTGISLAGLHGWSLENCAQQSGTDAGTLKDWYHGTLGVDLENVVMGGRTFQPWREWIQKVVEPLYTKRYNELMAQNKCKAVDLQVIAIDEAAMPEVED